MNRIAFVLLVISGTVWSLEADSRTGSTNCNRRNKPNEVFSSCGNNNCQNTCKNPSAAVGCVGTCVPGCICAPGFLRNIRKICVTPDQCDPRITCGANEVFSICGNDGCQRTCANQNIGVCTPICTTPACICAPGFVRNAAGVCVLPSQCPVTNTVCTRANEVFSNCGNDGCQTSCTRLSVAGCNPVCSLPGCVCNVGFVRNANGDCVLPSQCPVVTTQPCPGANQVFSTCGDDGCQRTCSRRTIVNCIPVCSNPRCICQSGFVRNAAGDCVLETACPTTNICPANEMFSDCNNNNCQATCANPTPTGCVANPACVSGCVCVAGFLRNFLGLCVTSTTCNSCGANEVFRTCGNLVCEGTCANQGFPTSPACSTAGACTSRCFCSTGFVRNSAGACVSPALC